MPSWFFGHRRIPPAPRLDNTIDSPLVEVMLRSALEPDLAELD